MAVEISKGSYRIANDFVAKTYLLEKGRLQSFSLTNVLTGATLSPKGDSELFVLHFQGLFGGEFVKASALKLQDALPQEDAQQLTLKIFFKPFKVRGCKIELQYVERLNKLDHFLESHLVLQCDGGEKAVLDYIDFAPFDTAGSERVWAISVPEKAKDEMLAPLLGQPVFFENAFFACRFPAALGSSVNGHLQVRRYYGRSLAALTGTGGVFVSDAAVCGVVGAAEFLTVRESFLAYIETIAHPTYPRTALRLPPQPVTKQTQQTVLTLEKEMQSAALPFADTVLLNKAQVYPDAGIFEFPGEIPMAFRSLSQTVLALGASPALEIGGQSAEKGLFAKRKTKLDACLADPAALENLKSFLELLTEKCGVTDWIFRLPFEKPCREKTHAHEIGGDHGLYYYSDLWEKWINLFCSLQKHSTKTLHFVLAGGAPLSPFLLQWVDAIALPQMNAGKAAADLSPVARRLCAYYNVERTLGLCLPKRAVLLELHDLSRGTTPAALLTAAEGANLRVISAAEESDALWSQLRQLRLLQTTHASLLRKAVLFGGDPAKGEFCGFAAFDSGEGLVSICNTSNAQQTISFALDELLGVPKRFLCVGVCVLFPLSDAGGAGTFRFGDQVQQTLAPQEVRVLHFGRRKQPLQAVSAQPLDSRTLRLRLNQPVLTDQMTCEDNPLQAVTPGDDGTELELGFQYPFQTQTALRLDGVCDLLRATCCVPLHFSFTENGLLPLGGMTGTGAFSIKATFGSETTLQVYLQGDRLALLIEDGYVTFRVGDAVLRSKSNVYDVVQICAVREESGTLKLYLNGHLDGALLPPGEKVDLLPAQPLCFDVHRTKLYGYALPFDEV